MELAKLRYFYTVAKYGHVTRAAEAIHIAQPALTKAIKQLEEEFKTEGRVVIRPSGTEPLIRVMIEGNDIEYIQKRANEIANLIEEKYSK